MFTNLKKEFKYICEYRFNKFIFVDNLPIKGLFDDFNSELIVEDNIFTKAVAIWIYDNYIINKFIVENNKIKIKFGNNDYEIKINLPYNENKCIFSSTQNNKLWLPLLQKGYISVYGENYLNSNIIDVFQNLVSLPYTFYKNNFTNLLKNFIFNKNIFYIIKIKNLNNYYRLIDENQYYNYKDICPWNYTDIIELYVFKNDFDIDYNLYYDIDKISLVEINILTKSTIMFSIKQHIDLNNNFIDFYIMFFNNEFYDYYKFNSFYFKKSYDLDKGLYYCLIIPQNYYKYSIDFNINIQSNNTLKLTKILKKSEFYLKLDNFWINHYNKTKENNWYTLINDKYNCNIYEYYNQKLDTKTLLIHNKDKFKKKIFFKNIKKISLKANLQLELGKQYFIIIDSEYSSIFWINSKFIKKFKNFNLDFNIIKILGEVN